MPKVEGHNEWSLQKNGLDCIVGLVAGWVVGGALAQEVCNTPECQIAGMDIKMYNYDSIRTVPKSRYDR